MDSPEIEAAVAKWDLPLVFNNLRIKMILAPVVHTLLVQWI